MPELIRPDDAALKAAMDRSQVALAAVISALGEGQHTLNIISLRTDDTLLSGRADLSIIDAPFSASVLSEEEFFHLRVLLTFAIEGSTVRNAVLVSTTGAEPLPRACAWTVSDGWPRPMDADVLGAMATPCAGSGGIERDTYTAPELSEHA
ncbi:hypothetical protein [Streptomyces sp. NPDC050145]|uniref:hypothetical protein n=1 Tax=Streptomyces sp. NPDC050145 TaxID=3365602 RepID=UPI003795CA27